MKLAQLRKFSLLLLYVLVSCLVLFPIFLPDIGIDWMIFGAILLFFIIDNHFIRNAMHAAVFLTISFIYACSYDGLVGYGDSYSWAELVNSYSLPYGELPEFPYTLRDNLEEVLFAAPVICAIVFFVSVLFYFIAYKIKNILVSMRTA